LKRKGSSAWRKLKRNGFNPKWDTTDWKAECQKLACSVWREGERQIRSPYPYQPEVALRLLDEYFALGDHFDQAQAHADRASAYLALGDVEHAIAALEAALAREELYPRLLTYAYLDLPFLVASHGIESRYKQALQLLEQHRARLTFPVDHFRWHATYALILSALAKPSSAREHARLALAAAAKDHSGFRYHPSVGLVGSKYENIREQLSAAAA
jgi:tetratricopeptide (TPR) repeat protein